MSASDELLTLRQFIEDLQKLIDNEPEVADLKVYSVDDCGQNNPACFAIEDPDWRIKERRIVIF